MAVFSPVGSSTVNGSVTVEGAKTRSTFIVNMVLANTEYTFDLPVGTKQYLIKLRDGAASFQSKDMAGGDYLTVPRHCFLSEDDLNLDVITTLYIQSPVAGQVAEIVTWI